MKCKRTHWLAMILCLGLAWAYAAGQQPVVRLLLIPPSPVTDKIVLDIRGAAENRDNRSRRFTLSLYLDHQSARELVRTLSLRIPAHASTGIYYRRTTQGWAGRHRIILAVAGGGHLVRCEREVVVLPSAVRSTRTIDGAWMGIVHWSEEEGSPLEHRHPQAY